MESFLIGFGSNQGESSKNCLLAVEKLRGRFPLIRIIRISSLYRTKPVGPVEQEWFVNGVLQGETSLTPQGLFTVIQQIEKDLGRLRTVPWGPRTIDLDILAYGERTVCLPHLRIPHPQLHKRLFVLVPLAEIAPSWVHPELGISAGEMLESLLAQEHDEEVQLLEMETS